MKNSMCLLSVQQKVYGQQSKTNLIYSFYVPKNQDELVIHFSYTPKKYADLERSKQYVEASLKLYAPYLLEDPQFDYQNYLPLHNLITVSVDYENEYLGCAHRQSPNQTIKISENSKETTEGFYPTRIDEGLYRIVLSIHMVLDECDVNLEVLGVCI